MVVGGDCAQMPSCIDPAGEDLCPTVLQAFKPYVSIEEMMSHLCYDLNVNCHQHRLTSEEWSPAGGTLWEGCGTCRRRSLMEEEGLWGWALRSYSTALLPVSCLLPECRCS